MPECVTGTTGLFISRGAARKSSDAPGAPRPKIGAGAVGEELGGAPHPPSRCSGGEIGSLIVFPSLGRRSLCARWEGLLRAWGYFWGEQELCGVGFSAFGGCGLSGGSGGRCWLRGLPRPRVVAAVPLPGTAPRLAGPAGQAARLPIAGCMGSWEHRNVFSGGNRAKNVLRDKRGVWVFLWC